MNQSQKGIRCHLTTEERYKIQHLLDSKVSIRKIAELLGRNPSTILREINRHTKTLPAKATNCVNKKYCTKKHVCGNMYCRKSCKNCFQCKKYCTDYSEAYCEAVTNPPYLCNGCTKIPYCSFKKKIYKAITADKEYHDMLVNRRNGFDLSYEQLEHINTLVSPLIKKGLSPYHIVKTLGTKLDISESTLRRLIDANELDAHCIDLRTKVKMKPRKKATPKITAPPSKAYIGHLYEDYLEYIKSNDVMVVQMDCVEGIRTDSAVLLTLHFPVCSMQLAFILDRHTSSEVVSTLDKIEEALGTELFKSIFEVILTDNGHEFKDINGIENSIYGGKRTTVFYCEPNRSYEKGSCENNHKLIRYVIPKGTSLESFMQKDISLMMDHINSYARKSLFGKTPYQAAKTILPEDFFILLGLSEIPAKDVTLKPSLLKKKVLSK